MRYLERFDMKIISANAEDLYVMIKHFSEDHDISFSDAKDIILTSVIGSLGVEQNIAEIAKKMDRLS